MAQLYVRFPATNERGDDIFKYVNEIEYPKIISKLRAIHNGELRAELFMDKLYIRFLNVRTNMLYWYPVELLFLPEKERMSRERLLGLKILKEKVIARRRARLMRFYRRKIRGFVSS